MASIDNARSFALMHLAATDAFITGWAIKKQYAVWRPEAAIRQAAIKADPNWLPLLNTPDHPDYVSGHCTTSGASAETLRLVLGNDGVPFTATVAGGMSRSYQNLTQAEKESAMRASGPASTRAPPTSTAASSAARLPILWCNGR